MPFRRVTILIVTLLTLFAGVLLPAAPAINLIGSAPTLTAAAQIRTTTLGGVRYFRLNDIATAYGMTLTQGKTLCTLKGKTSSLTLVYNKRYGSCNNTKLALLFAPFATSGSSWISELDYRHVLLPLITPKALTKHAMKTICIDPGHGGNDQGTKGRLYKEKDINLRVALKLRDRLRALGYRVIMTRSSDVAVTLEKRSQIAAANKANLFISIHCNSSGSDKTVNGIETFCLTPSGGASTHDSKPRNATYIGNAHGKNGFRLSHEIHKGLIGTTRTEDRGVKHARFVVLRNTPCPSSLIELGFLSNNADERNLGSVAYQDKLAQAIASAVARYHTVVK